MDSTAEERRLDPRLEVATHPLVVLGEIHVRLVDDRRWPWVMLTFASTVLKEIDDLSPDASDALNRATRDVALTLKKVTGLSRTNVATLGNVVESFHLHVVAREPGDPNWPGPVWGFGEAVPYERGDATRFRRRFNEALERRAAHLRPAREPR